MHVSGLGKCFKNSQSCISRVAGFGLPCCGLLSSRLYSTGLYLTCGLGCTLAGVAQNHFRFACAEVPLHFEVRV